MKSCSAICYCFVVEYIVLTDKPVWSSPYKDGIATVGRANEIRCGRILFVCFSEMFLLIRKYFMHILRVRERVRKHQKSWTFVSKAGTGL